MTMRVAIVNPVWETSARTPEETLARFPSLTGWAEALVSAGVEVTVHQRFPTSSTLEQGRVTYAFVRDGDAPNPGRWRKSSGAMAASVQAAHPDIVHVNGVIFPAWLRSFRQSVQAPARIVAQDHGGWDPAGGSAWVRWMVRRGLSVVDAVLVSSPGHASAWRAASAVPPNVHLADVMEASTSLRPMPISQARAVSSITGSPAILWVGRLTRNKDPLTMIEGFAQFVRMHPDATMSMVFTDDTLAGEVRDRIHRDPRLPSRVRMVGVVPHNQMAAYYSAADIYVSASLREGSGYAAIEAMACGAAPVLTDIPSFQVLTDNGRVGALWRVGAPESLCDALVKVVAEPRQALRTRVMDRFNSALSWDVLGRRALQVYAEICGR